MSKLKGIMFIIAGVSTLLTRVISHVHYSGVLQAARSDVKVILGQAVFENGYTNRIYDYSIMPIITGIALIVIGVIYLKEAKYETIKQSKV